MRTRLGLLEVSVSRHELLRRVAMAIVVLAAPLLFAGAQASSSLSMMPLPAHAISAPGALVLDRGFDLVLTGHTEPRLQRARVRFLVTLGRKTGVYRWHVGANLPRIVIHTEAASAPVQQLGEDESYHLQVTPAGVSLSARTPLGTLHGLQTLIQLVHPSPEGFVVSSVTIDDQPRFPWRGLMIDTARHFMPKQVIEQNLDGMEAVKLNVLHWHVSDDQGFRIESRRYPRLTALGSDGLFYTQADVREVIEYARDRGIRVLPEFETPSHASAMFPGYPDIGEGPGRYRLKRRLGQSWERKRDAAEDSSMDPTSEATYTFLDGLIGEMSSLFPDAYFHVGGDAEDALLEWKTNPRILQYMNVHLYKDTRALQMYFTSRVQKLLAKHGKTMVGWDEVLQPDSPKDVVIQSWRGLEALSEAARGGNRVVLSWGYYLDLNEPASRHYAVDPFDKEAASLTDAQKKNVLGGEAAMWSEYVTEETIGGRIWPMAGVVAERLWSPRETTDADSMYRRLDMLTQQLTYTGLDFVARREEMYQRMLPGMDATPLKVLGSVVEPPQGYPRGGERIYDAYSPLNHLADVIPPESGAGREFKELCTRIAAGRASDEDVRKARAWLTLWRGNDGVLQPELSKGVVTAELAPLSNNLKEAAVLGLAALDALGKKKVRAQSGSELTRLGERHADLTLAVIPGIRVLMEAAK